MNEQYWTERYIDGRTGWDLGEPSPPLRHYIDGLKDRSLKILIPGAGNSHEWCYLMDAGFTNASVVDISEAPLSALRERYPEHNEHLIHMDFFEMNGSYDLILEQTFFCALHPSLRTAYATKMQSLLKPGGRLAGVFFDRTFEKEGPPFGGSQDEFRRLFSPFFEIEVMERCINSATPRQGSEAFIILRRGE